MAEFIVNQNSVFENTESKNDTFYRLNTGESQIELG
jgi:hypothetical protein